MDRKSKVGELIRRGYELEGVMAANLSKEEKARTGTLEAWSAKDIIAHNATWKDRLAQNISIVLGGGEPNRPDDYDYNHENDEIYAANRDQTWEKVLSMAAEANESLIQETGRLSAEDLENGNFLPWQSDSPFWRSVIGVGYTHPILHLSGFYREQ